MIDDQLSIKERNVVDEAVNKAAVSLNEIITINSDSIDRLENAIKLFVASEKELHNDANV